MSEASEAVVRRFFEEMCNQRRNEIAPELFTDDYTMHDPQVPCGVGPQAMVDVVSVYQTAVEGHWEIEDIFSAEDMVCARWTGSGRHVGEINGIPATGRDVPHVAALSMFKMRDGKIAEMWEVWDTLGFLQQIGAIPVAAAA